MGDLCRHRNTWLLGVFVEWCYQCGALRQIRRVQDTSCTVEPVSPWVRPTGESGPNPWQGYQKRSEAYRRRYLKESKRG